MKKQLVLAEKPSVGRELARVLGCRERHRGYSEGETHVVTWALGHLVELAQPAEYGERYRRWSMETLPMLPGQLHQTVMEQTADQYRTVESLMRREDVDALVIATDAGREGELVARWIMKMAGWNGPVKRLWISSQTDAAITLGFANLKDGSLYENLYAAAEARSAADWYVGMNVTRALTCRYDAKLSAGRVQTPTLSLMTEREEEIESFTGGFYWTLRADFGLFTGSWQDRDGSVRIPTEEQAAMISDAVKGKEGIVTSVETVEKAEQPPLAYDLTELQRDANLLLSYSAKDTLDILQRLYETHKVVTYPRTDSRYITGDIVPTIAHRLRALDATVFGQLAGMYARYGFREDMDRFVMESGVTDHHAIIPTEQPVDPGKLSQEERALWELIVLRFMEVLSGDYIYRTTTLEAAVGENRFVARTTVPVRQGWRDMARVIGRRSVAAVADMADESSREIADTLAVGDRVAVGAVRVRRNATAPPERYTEATLLSAMEHAGRFVEDAVLKRRLGGGLGTPATRADIIEKLLQNHYVQREGKYLVPTPKGRELVRLSPSELRSPELTARWEERLAAIAEGRESQRQFIEDIKRNASALVADVASSRDHFAPRFSDGKTCPYCSGPMMRAVDEFAQVHYICQRLSCSYEEALVKKRKTEFPADAAKRPAAKKVVARTQAVSVTSAAGKKVVVVKRGGKQHQAVPEQIWETVVQVVRPPIRAVRAQHREQDTLPRKERRGADFRDRSPAPNRYAGESDSGSTFAELLAASEKRKRERENRKKK